MQIEDLLKDLEGFDWDDGNRDKNWRGHQVESREAEQVFFNRPVYILEDPAHSAHETRWGILGMSNAGRRLAVNFTKRGNKIRIISARDMSRRERKGYEEAKKDPEI